MPQTYDLTGQGAVLTPGVSSLCSNAQESSMFVCAHGAQLGTLFRVMTHGASDAKVLIDVVERPEKLALAQLAADALGIARPEQSRGSSVDSRFLDRLHTALTGDESTLPDAYRKVERVLQDLGLTYDPFWDTSESAEKGGSTVTNRAYSRIMNAVTGVPRCFIINVNDGESGSAWETDHEFRYAFDPSVSGRRAFMEAGPGARVVYYATRRHRSQPMHFIGHAEVEYIDPGWTGPWEATIAHYVEFSRALPIDEVETGAWNRQISITEITHRTYLALLQAGGNGLEVRSLDAANDPGGAAVAERVLEQFPVREVVPGLVVPPLLPLGSVSLPSPREPVYEDSRPGTTLVTGDLPTPKNAARNKLAETRAVELVTQALEAQGWTMVMDQQKWGVGYDLLFQSAGRRLHAEVKGIISGTLAFNLTPKESWRVQTDEDFAVIAVTNVLSPTAFELHFLTRRDLADAERIITGYRLKF